MNGLLRQRTSVAPFAKISFKQCKEKVDFGIKWARYDCFSIHFTSLNDSTEPMFLKGDEEGVVGFLHVAWTRK